MLWDLLAGSIMNIKSVYKVQKGNWQGDPCAPRAYVWDGVGCSYNDSDFPRITSLYVLAYFYLNFFNQDFLAITFPDYTIYLTFRNLSSSGLSGKIAPSLSNLTMLKSL